MSPLPYPCDWCGAVPARQIVVEAAVYEGGLLKRRPIFGYACPRHEHLGLPDDAAPATYFRRRRDRSAVQMTLLDGDEKQDGAYREDG